MAKGKNKNGLSRKIMEKKENGSEINKSNSKIKMSLVTISGKTKRDY